MKLLKGEFSKEVQRLPFIREFVEKYGDSASAWDEKQVQARAVDLAKIAYQKIWKID